MNEHMNDRHYILDMQPITFDFMAVLDKLKGINQQDLVDLVRLPADSKMQFSCECDGLPIEIKRII